MARKEVVQVPHSNMKEEIVRILKKQGYIRDMSVEGGDGKRLLNIFMKYTIDQDPVIQGLKRVSTPGRRTFVNAEELPRVLGGLGMAVLSTSQGMVTDKEARKAHIGGEVMCYVW